jgi:type II secretory pathway predicted ATPase ExeA
MSVNYWGFTRTPFTKDLPIQEFFPSAQFRELTARLHLMVEGRLFGVVTGEVGSGKSSAVRYLAAQLDPALHPVFYIAESQLTPFDFYSQVLEAAGVTTPFHRSQARRQFVMLMTDLWQHQHKAPVIVIDEGQGLPPRMIQELRLVLNTAMDALTPFTCVLVGQPDLRATLRLKAFEAIYQRVGLRFHLRGLDEAETAAYVAHHLQKADGTPGIFTPSALKLLASQSRGLPRIINHLATGALWDAESQGLRVVDEPQMQRAVSDWRDDG